MPALDYLPAAPIADFRRFEEPAARARSDRADRRPLRRDVWGPIIDYLSPFPLPVTIGDTAMAATSFDALTTARELKAAGIDGPHAEAIADAMRKAALADHDDLATKADLAALRIEIRIIGAFVLAIAAKLFGIFNAVAGVLS